MAGSSKTWDKISSKETLKKRFLPNPTKKDEVKEGFGNPVEVVEEGFEDLGGLFTPEIPEQEQETIIPMPTESTARTKARKARAKAKGSGRSGTILTEGLGG